MLHTDFDPNRTAVINPAEIIPKLETMPENFIGVFSHRIVDEYVRRLHGVEIAHIASCMGDNALYMEAAVRVFRYL